MQSFMGEVVGKIEEYENFDPSLELDEPALARVRRKKD